MNRFGRSEVTVVTLEPESLVECGLGWAYSRKRPCFVPAAEWVGEAVPGWLSLSACGWAGRIESALWTAP